MKSLFQDKLIEISYLSAVKWDKLEKSVMVFPQLCPQTISSFVETIGNNNEYLMNISVNQNNYFIYPVKHSIA